MSCFDEWIEEDNTGVVSTEEEEEEEEDKEEEEEEEEEEEDAQHSSKLFCEVDLFVEFYFFHA